jgi:hypothetical protein
VWFGIPEVHSALAPLAIGRTTLAGIILAFSSEVDTGLREEKASKQ